MSASEGGLKGTSTVGNGASENAYVRWCQDNCPLTLKPFFFFVSLKILRQTYIFDKPRLYEIPVGNGSDEFAAEPEFGAQLNGEFLRIVLLLGHVPLDLVDQRGVAHVDVQLDDDALVALVLYYRLLRERLDLLSDGLGYGRDEGQGVEVQVVAEHLGELFRRYEGF